jgi:triosephosphate isomerase (TIM)
MKFATPLVAALVSSTAAAFTASPSFVRVGTALDARKPFISGNWKLNPQTKQEAIDLAKGIAGAVTDESPDADIALFVPYVFLETAMEAVGGKVEIGAEVS